MSVSINWYRFFVFVHSWVFQQNRLENHMVWYLVRKAKWNRRNELLSKPVWWVTLWKNHSIQTICLNQPQAWRAALILLSQHVCFSFFPHKLFPCLSLFLSYFWSLCVSFCLWFVKCSIILCLSVSWPFSVIVSLSLFLTDSLLFSLSQY